MKKIKISIFTIIIFIALITLFLSFNTYNADDSNVYPVPTEFNLEFNNSIDFAFLKHNNKEIIIYIDKNESSYELKAIYKNKKYIFDLNFKLDEDANILSYQNNNRYFFIAKNKNDKEIIYSVEFNENLVDSLILNEKIKNNVTEIKSTDSFRINTIKTFIFESINGNSYITYLDGNNYIFKYDIKENTTIQSDLQYKDTKCIKAFNNKYLLCKNNELNIVTLKENLKEESKKILKLEKNLLDCSITDNFIFFSFKDSVNSYKINELENLKNNQKINELENYFPDSDENKEMNLKSGVDSIYTYNKKNKITNKYEIYENEIKYIDYYYPSEIKNDYSKYISKLKSPKSINVINKNDKNEVYILDNNKLILKYIINNNKNIENKNIKNAIINFNGEDKKIIDFKVSEHQDFLLLVKSNSEIYLEYRKNNKNIKISENNEEILKFYLIDNTIYYFFKINENIYLKIFYIQNQDILEKANINIKLNEFNDSCEIFMPNKTNLYIAFENKIYSYILNEYEAKNDSKALSASIFLKNKIEFKKDFKINKFVVDRTGNLYLISNEKVYKYKKENILSNENTDHIELLDIKNIKSSNLFLSNNDLFILDEKNFCFTIKEISQEKIDTNLELEKIEKNEIYKIKDNAFIMLNPLDYNNVFKIVYEDNTPLFYCLAKYNDNFYFGFTNLGQYGFINKDYLKSDINYISDKNSKSSKFKNNEATISISTFEREFLIYSKPFIKSEFQSNILNNSNIYKFNEGYFKELLMDPIKRKIKSNTLISVYPVAQVDNKDNFMIYNQACWYYIKYKDEEGKINDGYILDSNLSNKTYKTVTTGNDYYKYLISLSKIGENANIYIDQNTKSSIVLTLKDGDFIYTKNPLKRKSDFTKVFVKKDGKLYEGYIQTKNLQDTTKIITKLQIMAIIVTAIFLITTIIIFIFIKLKTKIYDNE